MVGSIVRVECGDVLHDAASQRLGGEPDALEDRVALCMVEELLRNAVLPEGSVHLLVVEQLQQGRAASADPAVVFDADRQPMFTREVHDRAVPGSRRGTIESNGSGRAKCSVPEVVSSAQSRSAARWARRDVIRAP